MSTKPIQILNLDHPKYNTTKSRNINNNLPKHPFRAISVGSSNSGKTNWVVNLLLKHLAYDKCFIICPNCDIQPKYLMLRDQMKAVDDAVEKQLMKKVAHFNKTHKNKRIDPAEIDIDPIMGFCETIPEDLLGPCPRQTEDVVLPVRQPC